jgi:type I restriction enzyme R subunit
VDVGTLDRKPSLAFDKLLEAVALGARDEAALSSLAARLGRLEKTLSEPDRRELRLILDGDPDSPRAAPLRDLANALLDAHDPDAIAAVAGTDDADPVTLAAARESLLDLATRPFDDPNLRQALSRARRAAEQVIDTLTRDSVTGAGFVKEGPDRTVQSFKDYIDAHKDEITALQIIYSRPAAGRRLTLQQVKDLAELLRQPPNAWTTESLWQAYARLERDKVRGAGARRLATDLVSLVRHAIKLDDELVPYPDRVRARYEDWLAAQAAAGRRFTPQQRWWLDEIAQHVGVNLAIAPDDFDYGEFFNRGGRVAAVRTFGPELSAILDELNQVLTV